MPYQNNRKEKIKFEPHNRRAGVAKFKRNLGHRKSRRWRNRLSKEWAESRSELDQFSSPTRNNRNNSWEGDESPLSAT